MKAYDTSFTYLPRKQWKVIDIPDDLMVQPVTMEHDLRLCYSATTKTWYVLTDITPRPGEDIYQAIFDCGSWLGCYQYIKSPDHHDVPFLWGKPLPSKHGNTLVYLPIWESAPTGEFRKFDDGWEEEIHKEVYKIIRMYLDPFPELMRNTYQSNEHTEFQILEYVNLYSMVSDFESITGLDF